MREKVIEQKLVSEVKRRGGICPKWVSPGFDGMPDRIVLLPGRHFGLVEVKAPGERPRPLQADADIYIINRENVPWLIEKSGLPFDYDMVVIDELSSFKNWQAKRFKALMKVRPRVKRIVGLTGTPSSNGLMDLFAEYKVLDMGERLESRVFCTGSDERSDCLQLPSQEGS